MFPSRFLSSLSAVVIVLCGPIIGQTVPSITQDAKNSSCSNIIALVGSVTLDCSSLTPAQQKIIDGIPSLLHKIIAQQLDPQLVMEKLDEIIRNQEKQSAEIGKIKGQQGPWRLTPDIQQKMFDILKTVPKVPIVVEALTDSSQNFAEDIIAVFGSGLQWPTARQYSRVVGQLPIGIKCIGPIKLSDSMAKIEPALQLINPDIHCRVVSAGDLQPFGPTPSVIISVGERP
jgi:hypothetical protein